MKKVYSLPSGKIQLSSVATGKIRKAIINERVRQVGLEIKNRYKKPDHKLNSKGEIVPS